MPAAPKPTTGKSKAAGQKFFIDFSGPAADGILDAAGFEKFLHDRIKVDGKPGQLGDVIKVSKEGEGRINIVASIPFSKRYVKYLSKKYLKRNQLRDWLRVVATSKGECGRRDEGHWETRSMLTLARISFYVYALLSQQTASRSDTSTSAAPPRTTRSKRSRDKRLDNGPGHNLFLLFVGHERRFQELVLLM